MKRFMKQACAIVMAVAMTVLCTLPAFAEPGGAVIDMEKYKLSKVTSPYAGEGQADGLGSGDRAQSYCWASANYGDYVYIGTCYNPIYGMFYRHLVGAGLSSDQANAVLDVVYNGSWATEAGDRLEPVIVRLNTKTNEVKTIVQHKTSDRINGYRMAAAFKGKLYFVGFGVNTTLLEIDPADDSTKVVYSYTETDMQVLRGYSCGVRGLAALDDELILSVAVGENGKSVAKMYSSKDPSSGNWTEIADSETFDNLPALGRMDSITGGGIWDIVPFNGDLYVSIVTGRTTTDPNTGKMSNEKRGYAVYRGVKQNGKWVFNQFIGDAAKGAKYPFGLGVGESGAGNLFAYGDHLYIGGYNDPMLDLTMLATGNFEYMYNDLKNPASLYRMDKNGKIEMVAGTANELFPSGPIGTIDGQAAAAGMGEATTQYLWRLGEHQGKLYIGTFDVATLLEYLTRLTNGEIFQMTNQELGSQISYIKQLIEVFLQGRSAAVTYETRSSMLSINDLLDQMQRLFDHVASEESIQKMLDLHQQVQEALDRIQSSPIGNLIPKKLVGAVQGLLDRMPVVNAQYYLGISNMTRDAVKGANLYVSEDGLHYQTITKNGFNDKYNHGIRTFDSMPNGLYIGMANPFYGAQVWRLDDKTAAPGDQDSAIAPESAVFDKNTASDKHQDIAVKMTLNGNAFTGVTYGGAALEEGRDYTVNGDEVILLKAYLDTLTLGQQTLVFGFDKGYPAALHVTVINSSDASSSGGSSGASSSGGTGSSGSSDGSSSSSGSGNSNTSDTFPLAMLGGVCLLSAGAITVFTLRRRKQQ